MPIWGAAGRRQPEAKLCEDHILILPSPHYPAKRKDARSRWSLSSNLPDKLFTIFSLTCLCVKVIKWAVYSSIIIMTQSRCRVVPAFVNGVSGFKATRPLAANLFCLPSFVRSTPTTSLLWIFTHTVDFLGFCSHHNKWPQRLEIDSVTDFVVRNLQSGCQWGHTPSRGSRGQSFLLPSSSGGRWGHSRLSLG